MDLTPFNICTNTYGEWHWDWLAAVVVVRSLTVIIHICCVSKYIYISEDLVTGGSGSAPTQPSSGPGWVTQTCAGLGVFARSWGAQPSVLCCPPPALLLQEDRSLTKKHVCPRRLLICYRFSSQQHFLLHCKWCNLSGFQISNFCPWLRCRYSYGKDWQYQSWFFFFSFLLYKICFYLSLSLKL